MISTLKSFLNDYGLSQVVSQPTHKDGNLLDCVFVNNDDIVSDVNINQTLLSISHHFVVEVTTPWQITSSASSENADATKAKKKGFFCCKFFSTAL